MIKRTTLGIVLAACLVLGLFGTVGAQGVTYPDVSPTYWEGRAGARVLGLDGSRTNTRIGFAAMAVMYQAFDDSIVLFYDEDPIPEYGPGAIILLWESRSGPYNADGDCVYPPDYMYALVGTLGHDNSRRLYMNMLGVGGELDWTDPMVPELTSQGYAISNGMLRWSRRDEEYMRYQARIYSSLNVPTRPHEFFNGRMSLDRMHVVPNGPWFPPWWDWVDLVLSVLPEGVWEHLSGQYEEPLQ